MCHLSAAANLSPGPLVVQQMPSQVHQGHPNENDVRDTEDATARSEAFMGAYLWLVERVRQHLQTCMHDARLLAANLPLVERLHHQIHEVCYIHAPE
jgi:hypothetical protein